MTVDALPLGYSDTGWSLDRHLNLGNVAGLIANVAAVVWLASSLTFRLESVEKQLGAMGGQESRIVKLETKIDGVVEALGRIEGTMTRFIMPAPVTEVLRSTSKARRTK